MPRIFKVLIVSPLRAGAGACGHPGSPARQPRWGGAPSRGHANPRRGVGVIPGEYFLAADPIELNAGRATKRIEVSNRGDRPVQVGSHFHFFEVNRHLAFDRAAAYGMRVNIAAGTAIRFEPGGTTARELVAIA